MPSSGTGARLGLYYQIPDSPTVAEVRLKQKAVRQQCSMVSISNLLVVSHLLLTEIFGSPFECNDADGMDLKVELYAGEKWSTIRLKRQR